MITLARRAADTELPADKPSAPPRRALTEDLATPALQPQVARGGLVTRRRVLIGAGAVVGLAAAAGASYGARRAYLAQFTPHRCIEALGAATRSTQAVAVTLAKTSITVSSVVDGQVEQWVAVLYDSALPVKISTIPFRGGVTFSFDTIAVDAAYAYLEGHPHGAMINIVSGKTPDEPIRRVIIDGKVQPHLLSSDFQPIG